MILTVTLNPSIDKTVELLAPLAPGRVQRAGRAEHQPGGKGINVALAIHKAYAPAIAIFPAHTADPLLTALAPTGLSARIIATSTPTRTNTAIVDPDGTTTKVNEPGPDLTEDNLRHLTDLIVTHSATAEWLVLAGSLPPSVPVDFYPTLIRTVRERLGDDAPLIALDTSDAPLAEALAPHRPAIELPDLVKPNGEELALISGADASPNELEGDLSSVVAHAEELTRRGVWSVLATLGGNGAVLVTAAAKGPQSPAAQAAAPMAWHAVHEPVRIRSTVGAGDSSLAGYLLAAGEGLGPEERLRRAVAYGSAAAQLPGTTIPRPEDTAEDRVTVVQLEPRRPSLSQPTNSTAPLQLKDNS